MAKINTLLRRTYNYTNAFSNIIEHNRVVLNIKDSSVIFNDKKLELTKNEFKILYTLMIL